MKHRALFLAATVLSLLNAPDTFAQTAQPSLRWLVTIDKSLGTGTAGEYRLFGEQQELHVGMSVTNFSGPRIVGVEQLASGISFRVDRDGQTLPTGYGECIL